MIRMKSGVCPTKDGMKRASDGPFSLTDAQEERLVRRGVAEYVFDHSEQPEHDGGVNLPHYDLGMTLKQLQGIAAYFGLDASKLRRKQDVVDMLDAHFANSAEAESDPDSDAPGQTVDPDPDADPGNDADPDQPPDPDAPSLGAAEPTV